MSAPRLKTLAKLIKELWPDLDVKIERGYCNTDFKPRGCRYITRKGKGRYGNRLVVRQPEGNDFFKWPVLLNHNSAETYRHNGEVVEWIEDRKKRCG